MIGEDLITEDSPPLKETAAARPGAILKEKGPKTPVSNFVKGDCVYISSMDRTGIVYEPENKGGEVVVMVMKKKYKINHKRLSLYVAAKDLTPKDTIWTSSLKVRKTGKRKLMSKRHVEGGYRDTERGIENLQSNVPRERGQPGMVLLDDLIKYKHLHF